MAKLVFTFDEREKEASVAELAKQAAELIQGQAQPSSPLKGFQGPTDHDFEVLDEGMVDAGISPKNRLSKPRYFAPDGLSRLKSLPHTGGGPKSPSDWKRGPFKRESALPNPYLSGMASQEALGPAAGAVQGVLHGFDGPRMQLTDAIARQQTKGGPGLGKAPTWEAQSPHPQRMLEERGMLPGATVYSDYKDYAPHLTDGEENVPPGLQLWANKLRGPQAIPGEGVAWVPDKNAFGFLSGKEKRKWGNLMGRHTIMNHELEHARRQYPINKLPDNRFQWADKKFDEFNTFGEMAPSLGDIIFRAEQYRRENPGQILRNPPPEDTRSWYQKPTLGGYNPLSKEDSKSDVQRVPVSDTIRSLRKGSDLGLSIRSLAQHQANIRRATEFALRAEKGGYPKDALEIELPGGVKHPLWWMQQQAKEHGYWGKDGQRPLSMQELLFKNIENDPTKQQYLERMVRGEARKTREKAIQNMIYNGKDWNQMTDEEKRKVETWSLWPNSQDEQFDINEQKWIQKPLNVHPPQSLGNG